MKITDKYSSKIIEFVIYAFFACMTIYHLSTESKSILYSVIYFSVTNLSVMILVLLLSFYNKKLSRRAKESLIYYIIYLFAFTSFIIIVGSTTHDYDEYRKILGNCVGGVFYASILSLIALLKLIRYGFRKSR